MAHVTVASMIANARLYADERATAFLSDAEVLRLLNHAIAEHRDLLIAAQGPHHFELETAINTTANTSYVVLPDAFYRLLSVHVDWSSTQNRTDLEEIEQLDNIADRDAYLNRNQPWTKNSYKACMIGGQATENNNTGYRLHLFPTPQNSTTPIVVRYVKDFADLGLGDSLWITNGHDRMICLRTACEIRNIQGLPTTFLERRYEADRARIEEAVMNRSNEPSKIRDVEGKIPRPGLWRRLPRSF